jgi:hypothetical protein
MNARNYGIENNVEYDAWSGYQRNDEVHINIDSSAAYNHHQYDALSLTSLEVIITTVIAKML